MDIAVEDQIFISYSFRDRDSAETVCDLLENKGIWCWIAPRNILAGEHYFDSIVQAVQKSRAVILLLSRTANGSEHVAQEICVAFERKIRVLPVRLEDVTPQGGLLYPLAGKQRIDLFPGSVDSHLQELENALRDCLTERRMSDANEAETRELQRLTELAHSGDLESQHSLGQKSAEPRSVIFNPHESARWFRKAAEQGHAESAYQLARAYEKGDGVLRSKADSIRWMHRAASLGDARAQTKMGFHLLADKLRQEKALLEAAGWFEKAAGQGSVDALYQLSALRLEGRGVRQSDARALEGFRTLAVAGHPGAQYYLAWMLAQGRGTVADRECARGWAERAANQGHQRAAHLLREL